METGIIYDMLRAALFTLLVALVLNGSLEAQRAGAGAATRGNPAGSGVHRQGGLPTRFGPRHGVIPGGSHRHRGYGGYGSVFLPYDEPFDFEQPQPEAAAIGPTPPVVVSRTSEPPIPKAQVIEVPGARNSGAVKALPPTVFILANGERLETRRFVLTASLLSVSIDRQLRTVPLNMLDVNATVASNHERGIDLQIPDDRNQISVSF
jgi:hypothetical protein